LALTTAIALNVVLMCALVLTLLWLLAHVGIHTGRRHDRLLTSRTRRPGRHRRELRRRSAATL